MIHNKNKCKPHLNQMKVLYLMDVQTHPLLMESGHDLSVSYQGRNVISEVRGTEMSSVLPVYLFF